MGALYHAPYTWNNSHYQFQPFSEGLHCFHSDCWVYTEVFSCPLSSRKIQIDKVLVGEQFGMKQANLLCQWLTCNLGVNNAQSNGNRIYSSGKMRRHNTSILNILWINMQRWEQPICANKIRYQCNTISVLKAFFYIFLLTVLYAQVNC